MAPSYIHYKQKGTQENITIWKSLDLIWKQYHMCGSEIEKYLILSLYVSSIKYGKENYLKCDAISHVVMKVVLEMDFSISVKTLARLK